MLEFELIGNRISFRPRIPALHQSVIPADREPFTLLCDVDLTVTATSAG